jgi:hypothetical protein
MAQHKQGELEHPAGGWGGCRRAHFIRISRAESNAKTAHANLFMLHRVLIAHWHHIYLLPVTGRSVPGVPVCRDLWPPQHLAAGVCFQLANKCKTSAER